MYKIQVRDPYRDANGKMQDFRTWFAEEDVVKAILRAHAVAQDTRLIVRLLDPYGNVFKTWPRKRRT